MPAVPVPRDAWELRLRFSRHAWPLRGAGDRRVLRFGCFVSFDGGVTWLPWGACTTQGGVTFDPRGDEMLETYLRVAIPDPQNTSRLVRVEVEAMAVLDTMVAADFDNPFPMPGVTTRSHNTVAFETVASASAVNVDSVTTPNVTPAGVNRLLFAQGSVSAAAPSTIQAFTYGGAALTAHYDTLVGPYLRMSGRYQVNPSTTPAAVLYDLNAVQASLWAAGVAFSGVDQTTPVDAVQQNITGTTTNPTVTVPSAVGNMVLDHFCCESDLITVAEGGTARWEIENIGAYNDSSGGATEAGAASVVRGWTQAAVNNRGLIAFDINDAVVAGGALAHSRLSRENVGPYLRFLRETRSLTNPLTALTIAAAAEGVGVGHGLSTPGPIISAAASAVVVGVASAGANPIAAALAQAVGTGVPHGTGAATAAAVAQALGKGVPHGAGAALVAAVAEAIGTGVANVIGIVAGSSLIVEGAAIAHAVAVGVIPPAALVRAEAHANAHAQAQALVAQFSAAQAQAVATGAARLDALVIVGAQALAIGVALAQALERDPFVQRPLRVVVVEPQGRVVYASAIDRTLH